MLDNTLLISGGIIVVAIIAFFGALLGMQKAIRSGADVSKIIKTTDNIVDGVEALNNTIGKALLPDPIESIVDKVIRIAQVSVQTSQQLFESGQLPPDSRKDEAVRFAKQLLQLEGKEITPELEKVINGAVEGAVYALKVTEAKKPRKKGKAS